MKESGKNRNNGFKGGRYASTEEDLHKKAIALLDKCRIDPQRPGKEKVGTA